MKAKRVLLSALIVGVFVFTNFSSAVGMGVANQLSLASTDAIPSNHIEESVEKDGEITVQQNLEVGDLVFEPGILERMIFLGDDDETGKLTIHNNGSEPFDFSFTVLNQGFEPLAVDDQFIAEDESLDETDWHETAEDLEHKMPVDTLSQQNSVMDFLQNEDSPPAIVSRGTSQFFRLSHVREPQNPYLYFTTPGLDYWDTTNTCYMYDDYSTLYGVNRSSNDIGQNLYAINTETGEATLLGDVELPFDTWTVSCITCAYNFFYILAIDVTDDPARPYNYLLKMDLQGNTSLIGEIVFDSDSYPGHLVLMDVEYIPERDILFGIIRQNTGLALPTYVGAINLDTAEWTDIVRVGYQSRLHSTLTYDRLNRIIYLTHQFHFYRSKLLELDLESGAVTDLGNFPSQPPPPGRPFFLHTIESYNGIGNGVVPWLSFDDTHVLIPPGGSYTMDVGFSARGIDQPGTYHAQMKIWNGVDEDFIYLPIAMYVQRPYTWGNIKGDVTATEQCDINSVPVSDTAVNFYKDGELIKTTMTDENGHYSYALERGSYDVEVVMDGYVTARVDDVFLDFSDDIVVDLHLRHDSACLSYAPDTVFAQQYPHRLSEQILTFTNTGAKDAIFEITEIVGEGPVPFGTVRLEYEGKQLVPPRQLNIPEYSGPNLAVANPTVEARPKAPASESGGTVQLNENATQYGILEVVPAYAAHIYPEPETYVSFFDVAIPERWEQFGVSQGSIYAGDFLGDDFSKFYVVDDDTKTLSTVDVETGEHTEIQVISTPPGTMTGMTGANGFFYATTTNCGVDTTLFKIFPDGTTETVGIIGNTTCAIDLAYIPFEDMIYIVDLDTASLHKVDPANPANASIVGSGLGFSPNFAQGMDYDEVNGILYWTAYNNELSELRIIDTVSGNSVKVGNYPREGVELDAFSIAGKSELGEIPWLTEYPTAGLVPADGGVVDVSLIFDSTNLEWGDYYGTLRIANPPDPKMFIPIELRVQPLELLYLPLIKVHFSLSD